MYPNKRPKTASSYPYSSIARSSASQFNPFANLAHQHVSTSRPSVRPQSSMTPPSFLPYHAPSHPPRPYQSSLNPPPSIPSSLYQPLQNQGPRLGRSTPSAQSLQMRPPSRGAIPRRGIPSRAPPSRAPTSRAPLNRLPLNRPHPGSAVSAQAARSTREQPSTCVNPTRTQYQPLLQPASKSASIPEPTLPPPVPNHNPVRREQARALKKYLRDVYRKHVLTQTSGNQRRAPTRSSIPTLTINRVFKYSTVDPNSDSTPSPWNSSSSCEHEALDLPPAPRNPFTRTQSHSLVSRTDVFETYINLEPETGYDGASEAEGKAESETEVEGKQAEKADRKRKRKTNYTDNF